MSSLERLQRFINEFQMNLDWWWYRIRHGMWKVPSLDPTEEAKAEAAFEAAYLYEFPNPNRVGCPGGEVLRGLVTKELGISHPARVHIMQCSPCFQEFRAIEKALGIRHHHNEYMFTESDK